MLPPLWPCPWVMLTPELRSTGEPCCSAGRLTATPMAKIANIAANTIQACRRAATIFPNMNTCAAGISRIGQHLEEVREPVRVLERDGGVRVVEAAAVRPQLLDRDLRARPGRARSSGARPGASSRSRGRRRSATTPCEIEDRAASDDRERQQDVDERAVEVDPEVAERRSSSGARGRARLRRGRPSRPRRRRSSAPRARPSASGTTSCTRRRSTASSCW